MTIKIGNKYINTDNIFSYKYNSRGAADACKISITSISGKTMVLAGSKANALHDYLENRAEELPVEDYDDGGYEYEGH